MKKLLSIMSNLQTDKHFKIDFQRVDQHSGGKWLTPNIARTISSKAWNSPVEWPSVESKPFLQRAMNSGTRITGQLRQSTTSLHAWPITWDIRGCMCLFEQHSTKHTLIDKAMCILLQF